jgi:hypothetical protein
MNPQFLRPISPLPRKALCLCPQGLLGMVELLTLRTVFTTGFVWKTNGWQGLRTWWIPSNSFRRREGTMLSVETRWMERGWRNPQIFSPKRNRRSQQCKNVQNWSHNWWELLNTLGISRWGLNRALRKGPQTKLQRRKGLLLVDASIKVFIFSNVQQCSTMSNNV